MNPENSKELITYFIKHTDQKFEAINDELKELRLDIKELNQFKWKITGIAIIGGVVLSFITEIAKAILIK